MTVYHRIPNRFDHLEDAMDGVVEQQVALLQMIHTMTKSQPPTEESIDKMLHPALVGWRQRRKLVP